MTTQERPMSVALNGNTEPPAPQPFYEVFEPGLLLNDHDAEESVIGALCIDGDAFGGVSQVLTPGSFYDPRLGDCWTAMAALWAEGSAINQVTVLWKLRELDKALESAFITNLVMVVPTSVHLTYYADIVARHEVKRRLVEVVKTKASVVFDPNLAPYEMAEGFSDVLLEAAPRPEDVSFEWTWKASLNALLDDATASNSVRFPTGFQYIDAALGQGFERGTLSVLAADTGLGKSTLALQWALQWARLGHRVAFISYEMSPIQLARRALAAQTGIEGHGITAALKNAEPAATPIMDAIGEQSDLPLMISRSPLDSRGLDGWIRRLKRGEGVDILICDHIQEMPLADASANRAFELAEAARKFLAMAQREQILVLAVSQVNRAGAGKKLTPSAIRDSQGPAISADNIIFLEPVETPDQRTKMRVTVGKNRDGPDDVNQSVEFEKRYNRFIEWAD